MVKITIRVRRSRLLFEYESEVWVYFGPEAKSQKKLLCLFHCKPRLSVVSLESPGVECITQVPENREDVGQNHDARKTVSATLSVLK